ncbi:MAG TPA: heme-binding protein [Thermoanaerobaculia bacterium]|nr:heme-binding protein [Thermoanaerobaculia bacterium]
MTAQPFEMRAGAPVAIQADRFGPIAELAGTWVGRGFNLISKPAFQLKLPFVLQVNATLEVLTFEPIGGQIPDRGSQQNDINIFGMTYTQQVTDAASLSLLHVEKGMWINVPPTTQPPQPQTVARLSTVPHGDSLLAQGTALAVQGGPHIEAVSPQPTFAATGQPTGLGYFPPEPMEPPQVTPFPLPAGFNLNNPNAALTDAIQGQNIANMVVLQVSTNTPPPGQGLLPGPFGGGILNIPFVTTNANAISLDAVFWIETVVPPPDQGDPFLQLQYTQTVMLAFPGRGGPIGPDNPLINWPHISVATLVKQ